MASRSEAITSAADWPFYRRDFTGDSFANGPLTAAQAAAFQQAWVYPGTGSIEDSNPIVVGGTVYQTYYNNRLRALDVNTGALLWTASMGAPLQTPCAPNFHNGAIGAAAIDNGRAYVPGGDGKLYAFDATTGAQLWATQIADNTQNEFLWASAFPLNGRIYVGVATFGGEDTCGPAAGRLVAVTESTGAVYGTWWADTQHRPGGTIWTQPTYDPISNRLFVNTANLGIGLTAAEQPYCQAVVAIDPDTMQAVDYYQVVATDAATDFDFGASPALVDTPQGKHLIVAVNKNGFAYALDRNNLANGVVWSHQICKSGTSPETGTGTLVSPAIANGRVFVGGGQTTDGFSGVVAALDADTGQQIWAFHPDGFILAGLTAVGDMVIAPATGGSKGHVYVLGQSDGVVRYQLDSSSSSFISQTTFAQGLLFAGDEVGNVFALRPGAATGAIGPVTGLTATGGTGQVALSWTNPTGATYASTRVIQSVTGFASSPTPSGDQTIVFDSAGTSTTSTGLAAGTRYFYTAWARDTSGNWSASSATASATTASSGGGGGGSAVSFSDTLACSSTVDLGPNWTIVNGRWYCAGSKGRGESASSTALAKTATMTDTDVTARVQMQDPSLGAGGLAARESAGSYYAARALTSGHIQLLRVNGGTVTILKDVSQAVTAEPASHRLRLRVAGAGPVQLDVWFDNVNVLSVQDTSAQLLTLGQAGLYNGNNSRSMFDSFSLTATTSTVTPIGPITGLTATGGTNQVALSWTNPTGAYASTRIIQSATGFASSPTPTGDQTIVFDAAGTSKTSTGLAAGTKYFYSAWARDTSGNWSASSATASATTAGSPPIGPITGFSATGGTNQVGLSWTNPTGAYASTRVIQSATGYATSPTPTGDQTIVFDAAGSSTTTTGLAAGTTYFYAAWARDTSGNWSTSSATASATTSGAGGTPVNFTDAFATCTSTTDLGPTWTIVNGRWYCAGSKGRGESASSQALAKTSSMTGTDVTARVQFASATLGSGGVVARSGPNGYYAARVLTSGHVQLIRVNGSTVTVLGDSPQTVKSEPSSYRIRLRVGGAGPVQLDVWFGGVQVLSVQDTSAQALTSGQAGLYNGADSRGMYASFSVTSF